jgi:3-isopropylmalate/(R)-2-methylmalate dehydratase small subunit
MGLPIFELEEASQIKEGDKVSIDFDNGTVTNKSNDKTYNFKAIPPFMQELLGNGGLMNYAKTKLEKVS